MQLDLNEEQSKGLANFFFDLGKGFFLGMIGLSFTSELKLIIIVFGTTFMLVCVLQALSILKKFD
ncbi:MAG: hypothetical protein AAB778_00545 [Patescibacteria group bacterium]